MLGHTHFGLARRIGRALVTAVFMRDLPVVMGITLFFALVYAGLNLLVDLSYAFLDPRIRQAGLKE